MTQGELAEQCGIPQSVVCAYERGRRSPSVEALARLVAAAGLTIELAERTGPDPRRAGRILAELLNLADALPTSERQPLRFPPLPR